VVQIHSLGPLFINDLYHTRVTRNSEERLVGNQAFCLISARR
jgi:hypothetical protein